MARKSRGRIGEYTGLVAVFLLLLSSGVLSAEDFTGKIILEKTNFIVGEEFQLSILVPGIAPLLLSVEAPRLPNGLHHIKGPYMRPGKSGTVVDYYFKVEKAGRFIIGSFSLKTADKTGHTLPVLIKAGQNNFQLSDIDNVPPSVKWMIPEEKYYPGEIIPLMFAVENLESSDIMIESSIYSNNSGMVKRISRNGEKHEKIIITKKILTGEIFDVLFHDYIFIPFSSGTAVLPGAEVFLSKDEKSHNVFISGKTIDISPFPEQIKTTGAVGEFEYSYTISDRNLFLDDIIVVRTRISGTGNFYGITPPLPYADKPGLVKIVKLKDNLSVRPDGRWFTGFRDISYGIRPVDLEKEQYLETFKLIIPDIRAMKEVDKTRRDRHGEYYTLRGGEEDIFLTANTRIPEISDPVASQGEDSRFFIFLYFAGVSSAAVLMFIMFLYSRRKIYFILAVVFIILIVSGFFFYRVFREKGVYGVIFTNSQPPEIMTVPEEGSSIKKKSLAGVGIYDGGRVLVKGLYGDYYLIELSDGDEGWIKKENIRLE